MVKGHSLQTLDDFFVCYVFKYCLHVYMCTARVLGVCGRPKVGVGSGVSSHVLCWELNPGPLQEKPVFFCSPLCHFSSPEMKYFVNKKYLIGFGFQR